MYSFIIWGFVSSSSFLLQFAGFAGFLLVGLLGFLLLDAQKYWGVLLIVFASSIRILYCQKKKETCNLCLAFQCSQMICQNLECKA